MARESIRLYDKNKNGGIEPDEAEACPALKSAFAGIDSNRDRKLSSEELQARFTAYRDAGTIVAPVTVLLNDAPLPGATVTLTPEPCMLGAILELRGETGEDGVVRSFTGPDGQQYAGAQAGLYRVKVTKPGPSGQESVPAQYNAKTTLGAEVFGGRGSSTLRFSLTGR